MRRSRLALYISLLWTGALGAVVGAVASLPLLGAASVGVMCVGLAAACSYLLGRWGDRHANGQVASAAGAAGVGTTAFDSLTGEEIVFALAERLDGASLAAGAFAEMDAPALLSDASGTILVASQGLRELEPSAVPGSTIDVIYGDGFLAAGGGAAQHSLVSVGGQRFEALMRNARSGRAVITLVPAGAFLCDDDLDAFAIAVADGQTSFRFPPSTGQAGAALNQGLAELDAAMRTVDELLAGRSVPDSKLPGTNGLAPKLRRLGLEMGRLRETLAVEATQRVELEQRLATVGDAIDAHRVSIASLAGRASKTREAAKTGKSASGRGRGRKTADGAAEAEDFVRLVEDVDAHLRQLGEEALGFEMVADVVAAEAEVAADTEVDPQVVATGTRKRSSGKSTAVRAETGVGAH